MLLTFGCTEVTRAGTGPADLGRELRATAQIAWADPAEFRAVAARPNAICHLGHADTGVPTVLALLRTDETGSDAILIDFVCHLAPSRRSPPPRSGLVTHPPRQPNVGIWPPDRGRSGRPAGP